MAPGLASLDGVVGNVPRAAVNDKRWFHRDEDGKGMAVCLGAQSKVRMKKKPNTERTEGPEFTQKIKPSDEEVEKEEEQTNEDENGGAVGAAAREAAERADKGSGDSSEAGLFTENVKRASGRVAGKGAAKNGNFIVNPDGEIIPMAPHTNGAQCQ
jgi:hypothetical protein